MIHHWKAFDMEITDGENRHDRTKTGETTPSQTLNLKNVDIIKVSDKRECDTSLERS